MTPDADLVIEEGLDLMVQAKGERDEARFPLLYRGLESIDSPARLARAEVLEQEAGEHVAHLEPADWRGYLAGLCRAKHKRAVKLMCLGLDAMWGSDVDSKTDAVMAVAAP